MPNWSNLLKAIWFTILLALGVLGSTGILIGAFLAAVEMCKLINELGWGGWTTLITLVSVYMFYVVLQESDQINEDTTNDLEESK